MKSIVKAEFCYEPDTLLVKDVVSILKETNFMVPIKIYVEGVLPRGSQFEKSQLDALASVTEPTSVELSSSEWLQYDNGSYLLLGNLQGFQGLQLQFEGCDAIPKDLLDSLACRKGFRAGHCHDSVDTTWQSVFQIDRFKRAGRPYEHLPQVWDDIFEEWNIDISGNPARREIISDMGLQAAWRMWYGKGAFKHIPKEGLLSFRDADVVATLPCGTVFIQLFDDPLTYDSPENRRRQQAFRDHVDMDAVIARANGEIDPDCHVEFQEGNFEFGGTNRYVRWLDDKGKNVLRSRATRMHIQEYTEDLKLYKEWIQPAQKMEEKR